MKVSHLDKVLAHAERQLASGGEQRPTDVLHLYKKFFKIEEHRLRLKHQAGGGGREICSRRVELMDVVLQHVFEASGTFSQGQKNAAAPGPFTIVATGGYGRGKLNPFSDIDLMFLHGGTGGKVAPYVAEMIEQILYLLWDIGFKVGHSTRSVKEAIAQANGDMLTKTAMLEARFLAGDAELFAHFQKQFQVRCVVGHTQEYIAWRMEDQAARHAKFGDTVYMQEPHVKSGCGGLRDYQNLLWVTYFKEGARTSAELVAKDLLRESDRRPLDAAYDFLLRVRTDLHYVNRRVTDVLHLNLQAQIAQRLGYPQKTQVQRSEVFMKDYYGHARTIFRSTERITERLSISASSARSSIFPFLGRKSAAAPEEHFGDGFFCRAGQLHVERRDLFTRDPVALLRAFQTAQERKLTMSPELMELLSRRVRLVTRTFNYAKEPREIFISILSRKGEVGRILRMMHEVDFLGRYLPEFGHLTCLVQHEFFHRYTADEHTLVCIEKLDELINTEEPKLRDYRALFERIADPFVIYLALLLHDTGKGVAARPHSEASALFAQRVAARLQLTSEQRKSLILLVDHHVTLSTTARQRNIDDPATVSEFAGIIKHQANLDALMLITLVDGQGTSDEGWSDWKELLVWQLYRATSHYLADQEAFYEQSRIAREERQIEVTRALPPDFAEEIEAHFEFMPDNYFRAVAADDIVAHLRLVRAFAGKLVAGKDSPLAPLVQWEAFPAKDHSTVSICTWDRHQLLAKIAGSFSVVPINILGADIYTRGDHLVLDIFRVCNTKSKAVTEKRDLALVESTLREALETEEFDFAPLLEKARRKSSYRLAQELDFPTRISINNEAHPSYTLIDVQTPDRLGLLYDLLSCLGRESVYIALSRISTEKGAALDSFYVADRAARTKITDPARIRNLHTTLQRAAVG